MPAEFIYTTYRLARHYPPDRTVLEDISLSFYPGAKIGVIGPNGAGKSSLLRIMAGLDDGFTGEARLTPGFSVGFLSQEPQLDATKDVKGNVLDGVREVQTPYGFSLFALHAPLELPGASKADEVRVAIQGHVVDEAELVARYAGRR
jgi:ABC-type phosphate/phosphonate transport system ATPase subunit